MYNESYEEYIRSILGYEPRNTIEKDKYNEIYEQISYDNSTNRDNELEECYPEIYKIVYPMVQKRCNNRKERINNEDIENMTDEIYFAVEQNNRNRRQTRQINRGLRDLIKVLLIRELLNRPGIPNKPLFPMHPPFPGPRPPMRPPIRPRTDELDNTE